MDDLLTRLEALLAKATPGPWQVGWESTICTTQSEWAEIPLAHGWMEDAWIKDDATDESRGNASLITEAVTALPALIAEIRSLRARLDAAEKELASDEHFKAVAEALVEAEQSAVGYRAALEPFAAMGRVMEIRAAVTFGRTPKDSEVVCESSGEAGMGILTMGHFRDATALLPTAPGWGGIYKRLRPAQPIEARSGETACGLDLKDESGVPKGCAQVLPQAIRDGEKN